MFTYNNVIMPIGEILASLAPIAGSFGSAAVQQKYARKNWDAVNAYNHPKEQIKRLKEAGLPLATMFGGMGGSTSLSIDTPNVDPNLGVAEGLQKGMMLSMQKKQMALMDQELRTKTAQADIAEAERDFQLSKTIDSSEGESIKDFEPQFGDSNLVQGVRRERGIKENERLTTDIVKQLRQIDLDNAPEHIREQIDHIIMQNTLGDLQIKRDKNYSEMLDQITSDIMKGDQGFQGMVRFIKAWLYKFLLR